MRISNVTPVPNQFFDLHLKELKPGELKILLVVIRQTLGWIEPRSRQRKRWDWITHSQFQKKTNLSNKSISNGIQTLISKEIIVARDQMGKILSDSSDRRYSSRIYYGVGRGLFEKISIIN